MQIIIELILIGFVFWLVEFIPLASPMPQIIKAVMIIIAIVLVLNALGVITGLPALR